MVVDLWPFQTPQDLQHGGRIRGPDGRVYEKQSGRLAPRECRARLQAGSPLVLDHSYDCLEWLDGDDAAAAWEELRRSVTRVRPDPTREWSAGRWEAPDGSSVVYLTGPT